MLMEMPCSQFDEWFDFYQVEPFAIELEKFMQGQIAAAIYNASGNYRNTFGPADFYPQTEQKQPKTVEQQLAIWKSI